MASSDHAAPLQPRRFYLAAWRWHFYAGICVLPFIFILAVSGLAMLASEPLDRYLQADLLTVTPQGTALSAERQTSAVRSAYPHAELATLRIAASPRDSTRIDVVPMHAVADHGSHGESAAVAAVVAASRTRSCPRSDPGASCLPRNALPRYAPKAGRTCPALRTRTWCPA